MCLQIKTRSIFSSINFLFAFLNQPVATSSCRKFPVYTIYTHWYTHSHTHNRQPQPTHIHSHPCSMYMYVCSWLRRLLMCCHKMLQLSRSGNASPPGCDPRKVHILAATCTDCHTVFRQSWRRINNVLVEVLGVLNQLCLNVVVPAPEPIVYIMFL